jgi:signal transduction histidine kinase
VLERGEVDHDYRIRRDDGVYRWLHAEARLVRDSDGHPQEIVSTWLDITSRMEAEEKISELNHDLARTVEHLAAANKELEAFSYSVSHDLRAPLRAIDGFSRIVLDEHAAELDPEGQRYLQIVRDNTRNMALLIDDLLAFSRLSRQAMHTEPVRFAELVSETWSDLEPERDGRRIELAVGELPTVAGDPRLLKQVLVNLLGNAIKFTRTREVARIEVGVQVLDDDTVVFVRDNGVGFDMRYKDKLFGVFQRLHRADEFEGTGVGLATVARIVHRHGGRVWAEAEPERGATFYLSFGGGTHGTEQTD